MNVQYINFYVLPLLQETTLPLLLAIAGDGPDNISEPKQGNSYGQDDFFLTLGTKLQ